MPIKNKLTAEYMFWPNKYCHASAKLSDNSVLVHHYYPRAKNCFLQSHWSALLKGHDALSQSLCWCDGADEIAFKPTTFYIQAARGRSLSATHQLPPQQHCCNACFKFGKFTKLHTNNRILWVLGNCEKNTDNYQHKLIKCLIRSFVIASDMHCKTKLFEKWRQK